MPVWFWIALGVVALAVAFCFLPWRRYSPWHHRCWNCDEYTRDERVYFHCHDVEEEGPPRPTCKECGVSRPDPRTSGEQSHSIAA
jgi:hypothetical protein